MATALGVLAYVNAGVSGLGFLVALAASMLAGTDGMVDPAFFLAAGFVVAITALTAVGFVVLARGTLSGRRWAWWTYGAYACGTVLLSLVALVNGSAYVAGFWWGEDQSSSGMMIGIPNRGIAVAVLAIGGGFLLMLASRVVQTYFGVAAKTITPPLARSKT